MSWIFLLIASILEIGWPIGIKLAEITPHKIPWALFALITMSSSGLFLFLAQKEIPIGTAYAIWTGIGAAGTFAIGVLFFNDVMNLMRLFGIILIVSGVVFLKVGN